MMLIICTFNCRGLQDPVKRRKMFHFMKSSDSSIIHSDVCVEHFLKLLEEIHYDAGIAISHLFNLPFEIVHALACFQLDINQSINQSIFIYISNKI